METASLLSEWGVVRVEALRRRWVLILHRQDRKSNLCKDTEDSLGYCVEVGRGCVGARGDGKNGG